MRSGDLDPLRAFRESLTAQRSAVTAVSQLTTGTSVMRDILAVQNSLQVFNQWRTLTGASDLQRSIRAVSELNQRLTTWSKAVTAMNTALPDISALRLALSIPTGELRLLAETPVAELDDEARQSLGDLSDAVKAEDEADAPSLLSEWLLWLPTAAQARVAILAAAALCMTMECLASDAEMPHPDPHITIIVYALAAIVAFLEVANRS